MEWVIAVILIFGVGLLAYLGRPRADVVSAPDLQPLPRGPIDELPLGGMYTFGHLFRFDGEQWHSELESPPATEPVVEIGGSAIGTYCVTWDGIYRRTASSWVREHHSAVRLLSLCVTEDAAYVGGARRTLLHRQNGEWVQMEIPELAPCVLGPIAQAESGLYVGGNDFVLHARDGAWSIEDIPTEDVLMDVCTRGRDVWFAVQSGEILRSSGDGTWVAEHTASHGIGGITCASDGTLYAVGGSGNVLTSPGDGSWHPIEFPGQSQLLCVRCIDGAVLVGDIAGRIHVYTGTGWVTYEDDARCEVRDFFGTATDLLVATSSFYTT